MPAVKVIFGWLAIATASLLHSFASAQSTSPTPAPQLMPIPTPPTTATSRDFCQYQIDAAATCTGGQTQDSPIFSGNCTSCKSEKMNYEGANGIVEQSCDMVREVFTTELSKCEAECFPPEYECNDVLRDFLVCVEVDYLAPSGCIPKGFPTAAPQVATPSPTAGPTVERACQKEEAAASTCRGGSEVEPPHVSEACWSCQETKMKWDHFNRQCDEDLLDHVRNDYLKCQNECFPVDNECSDLQLERLACVSTEQFGSLCDSKSNGGNSGNLSTSEAALAIDGWWTGMTTTVFAIMGLLAITLAR